MFYQPIADTKTGKIRGMEALLRWELEPYGMVSPGVFMEWLEQDPCIFDLGNWILRTALTDVQKLRKETEGFFVNVNVAAAQLERREFRSAVMNILKETGARPEELCLELTERCRDLDIHFLRAEVEFFHSQGIKIALDDFGTGNSSLSLALELPFDELKVDMSFIRDIKQNLRIRPWCSLSWIMPGGLIPRPALRVLRIRKSATILSSSGLPGSRDITIPNRYPSISLRKCCARNQPKRISSYSRRALGATPYFS